MKKREKKRGRNKRKRGHRLCSSLYFCTPTERLIIACSTAQMNRWRIEMTTIMTIVLNVGIEKMFRFHWIAALSLSVSFFYQAILVTFAKCPLWVKCIIMKQLISSRSFFYQDWCFKIAFSSSRGWTNLAKVSLIILMKRCDWAAPKELNHRKRKKMLISQKSIDSSVWQKL